MREGKKINFVTVTKKRSSNEHRLLKRTKDGINDDNLENA